MKFFKSKVLLLLASVCLPAVAEKIEMQNPLVFGNNRITLITPTLFRLESTSDGKFIDQRTMFAYERGNLLADSLYTVERLSGDSVRITTPALRIEYIDRGQPFSSANLAAYYKHGDKEKCFTIRQIMRGNLGGPIETLDRVASEVPLGDGILTTDGWYVLDDNRSDFLDETGWITPRPYLPSHIHDYYCFVYGTDFKAALQSLAAISGRTPMTRKWVHGVWYSKYWDYTADGLLGVVDEYDSHDYPLDNIVLDMGWHTNISDSGLGHNRRFDWTGYTWNSDLIPDPKGMIDRLHGQGITLTLNDHPHDGLRPGDEKYPDFAAELGYDPAGSKPWPQFDMGSKKYMNAFFRHALQPSEEKGVDLWWVDWQQNYIYPYVFGTNTRSLLWINELYYRHSAESGLRGATFSRWGGWGDHRHPLHFSGDAYTNWDMLAYEIKLTLASGNAGCYFWAHDIGGHKEKADAELLARWVQFGAMSAALRIHSSRIAEYDRRPWMCGDTKAESSMHNAYRLRARIMPYVYSSVYQTHSTMVPLTRPMYIDYNNSKQALKAGKQYMFGDLMLVAPIDKKGKGEDRTASQKVWFPEGDVWYDFFTHERHEGGANKNIAKSLQEFPLFVKAGWVLPMQPFTRRPSSVNPTHLDLRVYPADNDCSNTYQLYEDDGISMDYANGISSFTPLVYKKQGDEHIVTVLPAEGSYKGQPQRRSYTIEIAGVDNPAGVKVNGKKAKAVFDSESRLWKVAVPASAVNRSSIVSWTNQKQK